MYVLAFVVTDIPPALHTDVTLISSRLVILPQLNGITPRIYLFSVRSEGVETVYKSSGLENLTVTRNGTNNTLTFSYSGLTDQPFEIKKV